VWFRWFVEVGADEGVELVTDPVGVAGDEVGERLIEPVVPCGDNAVLAYTANVLVMLVTARRIRFLRGSELTELSGQLAMTFWPVY
jgi:hypothetical protein